MKKQISALFAVFAVASMASAQTLKTQAPESSYRLDASRGFRVALIKPILDVQGSAFGQTSNKVKLPESMGFSLGYASLPIQSLGWGLNLSYIKFEQSAGDVGLLRLDGNLGYAMNKFAALKGGLNLSNFTNNGGYTNPSIGFQVGLGLQATENFGLDVSYVSMSQSLLGLVTVTESGPEIGLHATF